MRNLKYVVLILSILLIFFSVILMTKTKEPFVITTSPQVHSYKFTSDTESFHIKLLVNEKDSYYIQKESVDKLQLSFDDQTIPLRIQDIRVYESNDQFLVDLSVQIAFHSNDYLIEYDHAYLDITYTNKNAISLYIGEFNYLFQSTNTNDLDFINLSATYQEVDGVNTVSGIVIDLVNKTENNIIIKDIDILSKTVHINNDYITEVFTEVDSFKQIDELLDLEYSFFDYERDDLNLYLQAHETKKLLAPLVYNGDITFIHRFVLVFTYIDGTEEKTYVIDDFPYMNTSTFNPEYTENLISYEID